MAHLDCKYLYSSLLQLEIAFRNFKWIPLPHELDWYHYSVQFFRVLLFLPSGGSYLFYWLQGSQQDSKKICWCAQRWTLDSTSSATSSSKLICHTLLKWNWCAAMMLLDSFKLCASMLHWKLAIVIYLKHRSKQNEQMYVHE